MSTSFYPAIQIRPREFEPVDWDLEARFNCTNGADLAAALGYAVINGAMDVVSADDFVGRCTRYLQSRVGKPSPGRNLSIDSAPGRCTVITGGQPAGTLEVHVLAVLDVVRRGVAAGATHVYAA